MSPLFKGMLDEILEESTDPEVITLDFADEVNFARAIDFCKKSGYNMMQDEDGERRPRRLMQ